ncbi:MAG: hypothetical protein ACLUE2_08425 [Bacteroides cellulosilyticus]
MENGKAAKIYVDPSDWKGVIRAAKDLGDDIKRLQLFLLQLLKNQILTQNQSLSEQSGKVR